MEPPAGFEWVRRGRLTMLVRSDVRAWLVPVFEDAAGAGGVYPGRELVGGRGGAAVVTVAQREVVLRAYRRGGLPAHLWRSLYFGWNPRPFRELRVAAALRARGVPVVEVYGAGVRRVLPGCYRGWMATRYLAGARTLWDWTSQSLPAAARTAMLRSVGQAMRRLHDAGGRHPDLNLNNILIAPPEPGTPAGVPAVWLIDFDRARVPSTGSAASGAELARLRRSARKLDPQGTRMTAEDLQDIETAYHQGVS